jgi:hypothetical protein
MYITQSPWIVDLEEEEPREQLNLDMVESYTSNVEVEKEIADPNKDFLVCTNICNEGIRGFLMKEGHVSFYESIKLNEHEVNYVTHDMELVGIVHDLKMWRHYLLGRRFVLMTDHSGLRYLFDQPKLNMRQAEWMDLLSEFDFEIKNIKGKKNRVVNSLSISMKLVHMAVVSSSESYIKESFKTG